MIDDGYVVEKEIIHTKTDEEKNIVVEKQIIHLIKEDEKENLIEADGEKCCTHCYLVVVKGLVTVFVIPALIISSIVAWAVWIVLLPVTCCCPCCEICTTIIKFIWKFLSTVPVYLSDWVCNKDSDDDRYQMARKKQKKAKKKSRKRKSYATMETQTALDDLSGETETVDGMLFNVGFGEDSTDVSEQGVDNVEKCRNVTSAKHVTFQEDDVRLLDDGMNVGTQHVDEILLDCGIPMQEIGRQTDSSGSRVMRDLEAQVQEAYMSCTDNESGTDSDTEEDLIFIE